MIGKYIDILSIAHDFGDNRGVMVGPDLWRQILQATLQTLVSRMEEDIRHEN